NLRDPLEKRKNKLAESLQGNQLFRDIEDELAWIREKEQVAGSTNRGRDLIGVQNLIKKQQALIAEIANHESQIDAVCKAAEDMIQQVLAVGRTFITLYSLISSAYIKHLTPNPDKEVGRQAV
ncbi:spectrin repeat-containing domain protein, partial [Cooperia oncophora]